MTPQAKSKLETNCSGEFSDVPFADVTLASEHSLCQDHGKSQL